MKRTIYAAAGALAWRLGKGYLRRRRNRPR
jgi:hypothetical protein